MQKNNLTKFQKFETVEICRNQIKNAPYNPRKISEESSKKLKGNLKTIGLISPVTVNKITMNLVSGHQRIAILDSLEKRDDYYLSVAMVSLTEKQEKEQNIFMNNTKAQGEFDDEMLKNMLLDIENKIDFESAGLDEDDMKLLQINMEHFNSEWDKTLNSNETEESEKTFAEIMRKARKKGKEEGRQDKYIAVLFPTPEELYKFIEKYQLSSEYVDYREIEIKIKSYSK